MSTQMLKARAGEVTAAVKAVATAENLDVNWLREQVATGKVVIPTNKNHPNLTPKGIGAGLSTKVNANIGTSHEFPHLDPELEKLQVAIQAGADAVMDLSTGGDIDKVRREVIKHATIPVGSVPMYQAAVGASKLPRGFLDVTADDIFAVIEQHAQDGIDFVTVHCGITRQSVKQLRLQGRLADVVSRGGSMLISWMIKNDQENPLYEQYDRLLDICLEYDVTISLGDGMRPGCLADATDRAQIQELVILGELTQKAWDRGVQVMIEGPGHIPLDQVKVNMEIEKHLCKGAPFYVLGPLVTDVAPGYDHIVGAIGGALAAASGADFLCYVTPSEHLGLPTAEDVHQGVIATRIAAHVADIAKGLPNARAWDDKMAKARKALDWQKQIALAIDPKRAATVRHERNPNDTQECTMCGPYCAMKVVSEVL